MPEPFKNLVSAAGVKQLAARIGSVHPDFDEHAFTRTAKTGLVKLELKDRVRHVAAALQAHLPVPYPRALDILLRMLQETPAPPKEIFGLWPVCHFVEAYGLDDFEHSLAAMPLLTQHFTCEFALQPYLLHDTKTTLRHVRNWTQHENERVRRLASEGIRPRLPWGRRLPMFIADPSPVIRILNRLYCDPSELVRRSVANNINDISKDHPELAVETLARWSRKPGPAFDRLQHHALRTLLKQGHADALALRGFGNGSAVTSTLQLQRKRIRLGEALSFSLTLQNAAQHEQALMIDYALHFRKADGTQRPKIFKWTQRVLAKGEDVTLERVHMLKAVTVRRYYAGKQLLEILVNGQRVALDEFTLLL